MRYMVRVILSSWHNYTFIYDSLALEDVQHDHQVSLERLIKAKDLELDALAHSRDHAQLVLS